MHKSLIQQVEIPKNCEVIIDKQLYFYTVTIKGDLGTNTKVFKLPGTELFVENQKIIIRCNKATKKEKKLINTIKAHIKNLIKGVTKGHIYKLKICSSHFPMNVVVKDNVLEVKNFLGEKQPRRLKFKTKVDVIIKGNEIIVKSFDKELAGQTAADIEKLTRRVGFDRRIFQDGIYIYYKDGKSLI